MGTLICGLMRYRHWIHNGEKTEVLGDKDTGFILAPSDSRGTPD